MLDLGEYLWLDADNLQSAVYLSQTPPPSNMAIFVWFRVGQTYIFGCACPNTSVVCSIVDSVQFSTMGSRTDILNVMVLQAYFEVGCLYPPPKKNMLSWKVYPSPSHFTQTMLVMLVTFRKSGPDGIRWDHRDCLSTKHRQLYNTTHFSGALHSTVLHCTALHCSALWGSIM